MRNWRRRQTGWFSFRRRTPKGVSISKSLRYRWSETRYETWISRRPKKMRGCRGPGDGASPVSTDKFRACFFGNCALGAPTYGSAQPGGPFGLNSVEPTEDRRGIRCHAGQRRRQRARLKLPSGLLWRFQNCRDRGLQQTLNLLWFCWWIPPRGRLTGPAPGEVTADFHPLRRDGCPWKGRDEVTSTLHLAPLFYGRSPL